jgi:hypothetical protein
LAAANQTPLSSALALLHCHAGATNGKQCPDVCGSCNADGTCEYCAVGAMQVGNASSTSAVTCVKCTDPLCAECRPTPNKCFVCLPFWPFNDFFPTYPVYEASNHRCQKCVNHPFTSGCQSCDALGRCTSCDIGYALTNAAHRVT